MVIGIDPTVDFAFKRLLGSPEHPAITLHFLNAVLGNGDCLTDGLRIHILELPKYATGQGLQDGIEKGLQREIQQSRSEGEAMGWVAMLQDLLGLEPSSLESMTSGELKSLEQKLQQKLRERDV